jgi:hypothetical protein
MKTLHHKNLERERERERERHTHTHTHTHQRKGYRERKICSQVEEEEEFLQAESFIPC